MRQRVGEVQKNLRLHRLRETLAVPLITLNAIGVIHAAGRSLPVVPAALTPDLRAPVHLSGVNRAALWRHHFGNVEERIGPRGVREGGAINSGCIRVGYLTRYNGVDKSFFWCLG